MEEKSEVTQAAIRMTRVYFGIIATVIFFAACAAYVADHLVLSGFLIILGSAILAAALFAPPKFVVRMSLFLP